MKKKFQVSLIGSSLCSEDVKNEAYKIGYIIGKKGFVLINGGRSGVMEGSAKGCIDAGGLVVGILPDYQFGSDNGYCSIVIPTGIGFARNIITAISGDIIIVVAGEAGTLCELSYSWIFKKVIICCSWIDGVSKDFAGKILDNKFIKEDPNYKIIDAKNLEDLEKYLDYYYSKFLNY
ncbi:MAG: TIGR00725 family protein [Spirochaetes bacterium]|nr:TIGR00725 family protein [Spirochaetota bacterium]